MENPLDHIRYSFTFRRMPKEKVDEAYARMKRMDVEVGQEIIKQGERGDAFYVIESGEAEVWRKGADQDEPELVAKLVEGQCFGEEALITNEPRNATVRMTTAGRLMVNDKSDFDELIFRSLVKEADVHIAKEMMEEGAIVVDVRTPEEYEETKLYGSINVPLVNLRDEIKDYDKNRKYLTCCYTGELSSVAAILMTQRGFDVEVILGGLRFWPYDIIDWKALV